MAFPRITQLARVWLALCTFLVPAMAADLVYFPTNTETAGARTDGLVFYFRGVYTPRIAFTIRALREGKPVEIRYETTMNGEKPVFVPALVDPEGRHELIRVDVELAGCVYRLELPRSGKRYPLGTD